MNNPSYGNYRNHTYFFLKFYNIPGLNENYQYVSIELKNNS